MQIPYPVIREKQSAVSGSVRICAALETFAEPPG
jgi:hypothetical protein